MTIQYLVLISRVSRWNAHPLFIAFYVNYLYQLRIANTFDIGSGKSLKRKLFTQNQHHRLMSIYRRMRITICWRKQRCNEVVSCCLIA